MAGETAHNMGTADDFWLIKLDSTGAMEWQKSYGYLEKNETCYAVRQTSDGGYVAAGKGGTGFDAWVLKLDSSGNITWQKAYGGNRGDMAYDILQKAGGGYVVAGYETSFSYSTTDTDAWVFEIDAYGDITFSTASGASVTTTTVTAENMNGEMNIMSFSTPTFGLDEMEYALTGETTSAIFEQQTD